MPEQRRIRSGSTAVLHCYAATTRPSKYIAVRQRRSVGERAARRFHVDGDTSRKLRHGRRATRQRTGSLDDGWTYEWRQDDTPINAPASRSGRFSVDPIDHSLTIRNASSTADTAMYSCVRRRRSHGNTANSSNTDDVITSRLIQLVVEGNRAVYFSFH